MADLFAKVSCTYCQEEINGVRVQCCDCPDFDICLQCFAVGAEIGPHKNDHPYKFVDHCAVSIFGGRGAWTGREHLRLLDAAELYSYGNWELVAKHVESRTAEECREEYTARYLDGNIGRGTWSHVPKPNLIIDLAEDDGPLSPAALAKLAPLDATPEEARVLGYKPHRDDFEREYNQEAEKLVADLQLEEQEETDIERALKLAVVDMYIRSLRERQRRKRIVRDYQLVAKYFDNLRRDPSQPLYPKAQKEFRDRMRPFTQFLNSGEHERLIASVEREQELRHRLAELMRYRSLGLATQEEIVHYEQHVAFQRMQIRQGKVGNSGSAMLPGPNPYLTSENGGVEISSNFTDARITWPSESDSGYDSEVAGASAGARGSTSIWTPPPSQATPVHVSPPSSDRAGAGDLKALPMGKNLSQGEIQLCTNLNLQPVTYATLKSLIIQDNLLSPGKYQNAVNTAESVADPPSEINVKEEVTKFLSVSGWLPGVSVN